MQTTDKYTKQINIVIDYINANIDKKLDLKSLARLTSLSAYHFHRIFSSVTGETLAKYIMRRRLELAAIHLRDDVWEPVMNIALELGFNSVNVFCRNFKKHFGITAEEYRDKTWQDNSKNRQSKSNLNPSNRTYFRYFCTRKTLKIGEISMNCDFEIKQLETTNVVYCRHYGSYAKMQEAFEKLMRWAYSKGLVTAQDFRLAAIYHDNPDVTEEDKLISDACLIVKEPIKTDGEIGAYSLNAGRYAVGRFEISWDGFQSAWECMYRLVDEHGCQCCGLPFEIYLNRAEEHPEKKWIIDIYIPVIAK
jgi:AraC family transcriptional regulator